MVDALNRLRHDAVVGGNNQNCDIRHHGTAGTHGGKRLMARCIQEGDGASVDFDRISTNMLRDAAGFP